MPYFAYVLKSDVSLRFYTGSCENLERRLREHNQGKTKSTRPFVPWKLVHSESFGTREEAYRREKEIKSYKGGNAFKRLINHNRGEVA